MHLLSVMLYKHLVVTFKRLFGKNGKFIQGAPGVFTKLSLYPSVIREEN